MRAATKQATIHPNKGQPPNKDASSKPIPQPRKATPEWRDLPAHYRPPASERETQHSAERERPPPDCSKPVPSSDAAPPDDLDTLVQALVADYASASSWKEFVEELCGKEGEFHPQVKRLLYATAELLEEFCVTGATVKLSTPKCSMAQKEAALK
jgi:hypothetical protein